MLKADVVQSSDHHAAEPMLLRSVQPLAWFMWLVVTLFSMYKFATQTSFAVINTSIADTLSLSLSQISTLGALYTVGFAIFTVPSGALLDRYGARAVLTLAAGIVCLGAFLFSTAQSWTMLVAAQLLMGAGGAFGFPGAGYVTRHWFPVGAFAVLFGLTQSVVTLSSAAVQAGLGFLTEVHWREILAFLAVFGVILSVGLGTIIRDPQDILTRSRESAPSFWKGFWKALGIIAGNRQVWYATIPGAIVFSVLLSVAVLWGIKLLVSLGFDESTASTINAMSWVGFAVGAPVIAAIAAKLDRFRGMFLICIVGFFVATLGLWTLSTNSTSLAYAAFFLFGVFSGTCMLSFVLVTKICMDLMAGTAIAVANMTFFALSGLMISLPGYLIGDSMPTTLELRQNLMLLPGSLLIALAVAYCIYVPKVDNDTY